MVGVPARGLLSGHLGKGRERREPGLSVLAGKREPWSPARGRLFVFVGRWPDLGPTGRVAEAIFSPLPSDVFVPQHLDPAKGSSGFLISGKSVLCFKLAQQICVGCVEKLSCLDGFARSTELTNHFMYL